MTATQLRRILDEFLAYAGEWSLSLCETDGTGYGSTIERDHEDRVIEAFIVAALVPGGSHSILEEDDPTNGAARGQGGLAGDYQAVLCQGV